MLKGKKVLFFSASFFGYHTEIKNKLIELGAEVDFYDERPKNTFWSKALIRLDKRLVKNQIENYYSNIISDTSNTAYDYIFFLKAEVITPKMLSELKNKQKKAKCILYMWDSIKNCESVIQLFPLFDKIFSFDPVDVEKNSFIYFRPLFYLDEYALIGNNKTNFLYDVSFVGTAHTDRYSLIKKIKFFCDSNNLKNFFFLYLQDVKIFFIRKLFNGDFRKAKIKEFSFRPLKKEELTKVIKESKCILDIERPIQSGLTMRTIEILGAKRKLITTNRSIKNYDFYNDSNICIIDRNNPVFAVDFINSDYTEVPPEVYLKYNLSNWLYDIFE